MSQDPFQEREAEKYANPIPSREFILEHLTKREKPASRDELAIELNIEGEEQTEALRRRLRAMERDGQLVFTRASAMPCRNASISSKEPLLATAMAMVSCALKGAKTICTCRQSR
ncbi:3'-to-5' exoribonuclease RNase R [Klebsiella pneumoniae]|uniref:3'-to-5' exoribonuclease RNase R n=1 Tax=Klebsiella pneumoniae TaxID=573 RepID=A0A2X3EY74_KLEPN|nr:3'-to-5' exoribonuclease RNase R [Klebsiella pneumoniae]